MHKCQLASERVRYTRLLCDDADAEVAHELDFISCTRTPYIFGAMVAVGTHSIITAILLSYIYYAEEAILMQF